MYVATSSGPEPLKVEISDDEDDMYVWDLLPAASSEPLPISIPDDCENEVNDACTETSDSEDSDGGAEHDGVQAQGRRTFEPPGPLSDSRCGSTVSQKSCTCQMTDFQVFLNVEGNQVHFTPKRV